MTKKKLPHEYSQDRVARWKRMNAARRRAAGFIRMHVDVWVTPQERAKIRDMIDDYLLTRHERRTRHEPAEILRRPQAHL